MRQVCLGFVGIMLFLACVPTFAGAPSRFTLSTMPRVDVHAHIPDKWDVIDQYNFLSAHLLSILLEFPCGGRITGKCPPVARGFAGVCVAGATTR